MLSRSVRLIARKELLDTLRDRRTLFVALVLPLLLYPALLLGMTQIIGATQSDLMATEQRVLVGIPGLGDDDPLYALLDERLDLARTEAEAAESTLPQHLDLLWKAADQLADARKAVREERKARPTVAGGAKTAAEGALDEAQKAFDAEQGKTRRALEAAGYQGALVGEPDFMRKVGKAERVRALLVFDPTNEPSRTARSKMRTALESFVGQQRKEVRERFAQKGDAFVHVLDFMERPVAVRSAELASKQQKGAYSFAPMLGLLLVLMALTGAFYPAVDLVAGEKERGTIETLLVAPVSRTDLVMGKFTAVWVIALVTALLNLAVMALTFSKVAGGLGRGGLSFTLPLDAVLVVTAILIPTCALFSAVALALSSFATSYKEGQHYMSPLFIVVTPLAMVALLPNIEISYGLAAVPVANVVLLVKAMLLGGKSMGPAVVGIVSMVAYAAVSIAVAVRLFRKESVLFRTGGGRSYDARSLAAARAGMPTEGRATLLFFVALALMFYLSGDPGTSLGGLVLAVLKAQLIAVFLPTLLFARAGKVSIPEVFGLRGFRIGLVVPVVLAAVFANFFILGLVKSVGYGADRQAEGFEQLVTQLLTGAPSWLGLFLLAVLPPLCEEFMCRGYILSAFRARKGAVQAVVVSAILFGVLHLSPARFPPTFAVGLLLGYIRIRTGSLWACVLVHGVYNGLIAGAFYSTWVQAVLELLGPGTTLLAGVGLAATIRWIHVRTATAPAE